MSNTKRQTSNEAGSALQETKSRLQEIRGRKRAAEGKEPAVAFVRAFVTEARPVTSEEAEDEAWVAQMMEWMTAPRATASSDVIRRVIARVECLA